MDDFRPALFGLHHPLKTNGVIFGHVGAFDHNTIGVLQILLERGCAASAKTCPQTGDG
jgi:hypothetical protein